MRRVRWEPCEFEDLLSVQLQVSQAWQDVRDELVPDEETRERLREHGKTMWTEDAKVIACVGLSPLWKGVATAWALLSLEALQMPVALSRGVRGLLVQQVSDHGYHRIQATVEHGHTAARRWLLWMGFSFEGTMRAYTHMGTDHDMYAKLVPRGIARGETAWRAQQLW